MSFTGRVSNSFLNNRLANRAANCLTTGRIRALYQISSQPRGIPIKFETNGAIQGSNLEIPVLWHLRNTLGIEAITLKKRIKWETIEREMRFLFSSQQITTEDESMLRTMVLSKSIPINRDKLPRELSFSWGMRVALKTALATYLIQSAADFMILLGGAAFFFIYARATNRFSNGVGLNAAPMQSQFDKIGQFFGMSLSSFINTESNEEE